MVFWFCSRCSCNILHNRILYPEGCFTKVKCHGVKISIPRLASQLLLLLCICMNRPSNFSIPHWPEYLATIGACLKLGHSRVEKRRNRSQTGKHNSTGLIDLLSTSQVCDNWVHLPNQCLLGGCGGFLCCRRNYIENYAVEQCKVHVTSTSDHSF